MVEEPKARAKESNLIWERVHTVNDFYEKPRLGVADYRGQPHIYEAIFSFSDDEWTDRYLLEPIPPDLFVSVLADWAIFERWEAAFQAGDVERDSHPALPHDQEQHRSLEGLIGDRLHVRSPNAFSKQAEFRVTDQWQYEVRWLD